jgi:hypothetical protein
LKALLYIGFYLFCSYHLSAQETRHFSTEDGLPSDWVYRIVQDKNGFIWIATNKGIAKYDGKNFTNFTKKSGLANQDVWDLMVDQENKLWFFSKSNSQGYIQNGKIKMFSTADGDIITPKNVFLGVKNHPNLYAASKKLSYNYFYEISQNQLVLKKIDFPKAVADSLRENVKKMKYSYIGLPNDFLYITVYRKPYYYKYDFQQKKLISYSTDFSLLEGSYAMSGNLEDHYFYTIYDNSIFFHNLKTGKHHILFYKKITGNPKEDVLKVKLDLIGNKIHLSIPQHLFVLDSDFNVLEKFHFPEYKDNIINYLDKDLNLWLINASGLLMLPNTNRNATYLEKGKRINKLLPINEKLYLISGDNVLLSNEKLTRSFANSNEYFTTDNLVYKIQNQQNPQIYINEVKRELPNYNIVGIKNYMQYNGNGYALFSSRFVEIKNKQVKEIIGQGFRKIFSFENRLYVATTNGLFYYNGKDLIKIFSHNYNQSTLSYSISNNQLFLGTDGGGVFILKNNKIQPIPCTNGLSVDAIQLVDKKYLWLATEKGAIRVLLDEKNLSKSRILNRFTTNDGLLNNQINDLLVVDSILYTATNKGVTKINWKDPKHSKAPIIKLHSKNLKINPENRNNVSISFSVIDFVRQKNLEYAYQLLPTNEKKWIKIPIPNIQLSNLDPGNYELKIRVKTLHNAISYETIKIVVEPFWWETIWFKIIAGILTLIFFIGTLYFIVQRVKKTERIKANQQRKMSEIELKALRSQMNPHFVHNSLNAIQYYIQRKEVELSEDYLSKFSKLIRMFFDYSRRQSITIEEEIDLLSKYLEIEKLRFEEFLEYEISVSEDFDETETEIPSMILQPIVENAVNHGIFHKDNGGKIIINFQKIDNSKYEVIISDTGIGINKTKELYQKSSKNYQSNSTMVLNERINLLNQSKLWNIQADFVDKSDINLGEGTIVTIKLKKLKS